MNHFNNFNNNKYRITKIMSESIKQIKFIMQHEIKVVFYLDLSSE